MAKVALHVTIDPGLKRQAKIKAAKTGRSISRVVEERLEEWVREDVEERDGRSESE